MTILLGYIGKGEGEKQIRELLSGKGYDCGSKKNISYGVQFDLLYSKNRIGCIRIFENKKGEVKVDLSAILDEKQKKDIQNLISRHLLITPNGKILLPQRFFFNYPENKEPLQDIKKILISKFKGVEKETKNKTIYSIIRLDGITVLEFKNGTILIQGKKSTELSDDVINTINRIYEQNSMRELFKILKLNLPLMKESEYKKISEELKKYKINVDEYISQEVYSYLNPNDRIEIRDGLLLLEFVKNKKLPLKNFTSLVRNFAVAYEGFLIKLLSDLNLLDLSNVLSGKHINIGSYLKTGNDGKCVLEKKYPFLLRRKPALANKMWVYWQECRNDYLHSDFIKLPIIKKAEKVESKIREIINIMEDCSEIFGSIINPDIEISDLNNKSIIGIDEAGKGDYFGPLVIGAVFVDEGTIKTLSSLGIRDSKSLTDSKVRELYKEIDSKCKIVHVRINPEKYNELYNQIRNLNQLLAWGHARALENMLIKVKCKYALSDQFGDENLIKSRLMQLGKNITLIQRPRAERNIAVAAASIVARYIFLEELKKLSRIYKTKLPKGASDSVEEIAKEFVKKYGKENLGKIAKLHFKTTKRILTGG